jgi:hypothetical protein
MSAGIGAFSAACERKRDTDTRATGRRQTRPDGVDRCRTAAVVMVLRRPLGGLLPALSAQAVRPGESMYLDPRLPVGKGWRAHMLDAFAVQPGCRGLCAVPDRFPVLRPSEADEFLDGRERAASLNSPLWRISYPPFGVIRQFVGRGGDFQSA